MKIIPLFFLIHCLLTLPMQASSADNQAVSQLNEGEVTDLTKGSIALVKTEQITVLEPRQKRVIFVQEGNPLLGALRHDREGVSWIVKDHPAVRLPYRLDTLVAGNGRSLLQYGDTTNRQHPVKTNLYFLDEQGQETGSIVDRYAARSSVVVAEDGFVAVAGELLGKDQDTEIGLYAANGEQRFQLKLDTGRRANIAVPGERGQRVAVFTTDTAKPLADHRLEILSGSGEKVAELTQFGILQKVVPIAGGERFFVQGRNRYGVVDAADGTVRWMRDGVLRLVSPHGAATDPRGRVLLLVAAEWDGIPRERYQWRVEARDIATGEMLASRILPEAYPGSPERVITRVSETQIGLLAGDHELTLDWSLQ